MNAIHSAVRRTLVAVLIVPAFSGCVCWEAWCAPPGGGYVGHVEYGYAGHGHHALGWQGTSMCFGYYPTCWRPWPLECPPCPPFALEPPPAEWKPPHLPLPELPPVVAPAAPGDILVPPTVQPPLPPGAAPNGTVPPNSTVPPNGAAPPPAIQPAAPMPEEGASSRRHWGGEAFATQPGDFGGAVRR